MDTKKIISNFSKDQITTDVASLAKNYFVVFMFDQKTWGKIWAIMTEYNRERIPYYLSPLIEKYRQNEDKMPAQQPIKSLNEE